MAVEEPATPACRLTDPPAPQPKCTCFRHLGKVIPCRHHREPEPDQPQAATEPWTWSGRPAGGPDSGMSAVVPYGAKCPDWMETDDD